MTTISPQQPHDPQFLAENPIFGVHQSLDRVDDGLDVNVSFGCDLKHNLIGARERERECVCVRSGHVHERRGESTRARPIEERSVGERVAPLLAPLPVPVPPSMPLHVPVLVPVGMHRAVQAEAQAQAQVQTQAQIYLGTGGGTAEAQARAETCLGTSRGTWRSRGMARAHKGFTFKIGTLGASVSPGIHAYEMTGTHQQGLGTDVCSMEIVVCLCLSFCACACACARVCLRLCVPVPVSVPVPVPVPVPVHASNGPPACALEAVPVLCTRTSANSSPGAAPSGSWTLRMSTTVIWCGCRPVALLRTRRKAVGSMLPARPRIHTLSGGWKSSWTSEKTGTGAHRVRLSPPDRGERAGGAGGVHMARGALITALCGVHTAHSARARRPFWGSAHDTVRTAHSAPGPVHDALRHYAVHDVHRALQGLARCTGRTGLRSTHNKTLYEVSRAPGTLPCAKPRHSGTAKVTNEVAMDGGHPRQRGHAQGSFGGGGSTPPPECWC